MLVIKTNKKAIQTEYKLHKMFSAMSDIVIYCIGDRWELLNLKICYLITSLSRLCLASAQILSNCKQISIKICKFIGKFNFVP